ncbi:MAG: hypoxanthine phosphoribosyltransferase [Candidatus Rokubacteria bacterium]|nr:hypoxanthine phosphoribosyltransferase [Candidatus Rokubacteria bacterium]MBI2544755.1 hypoxanthine phosphoribosyltransferase [Candidatus Rokubacteria bacterium]MBI2554836.1 hypoxanthine phosphoribosyltransferase [Candidatus Rokubacteria bacterium]
MGHRPGRVLITQEEIAERVRELGQALSRDYAGKDPLLVGVLKGAVVFLADLMRAADIPLAADFIALSSYGSTTRSSGVVKITADLSISIEDRHVVIVEDIIDSGRTISYLKRNLQTRRPASLRVMALLDKVERREVDVELDYVGFTIPNEFVVGYGLDYHGLYRNLPCIAALEENPSA